jgi:nucleotide-binding universal stress UspA family protein
MKTILIPTDYSSHSRNAIQFAIKMAEPLKARLVLFHAYHIPDPIPAVPVPVLPDYGIYQDERSRMKKIVQRLKKSAGDGVTVEGIVALGTPVDLALDIIEKERVDFVVMGTLGADNLLDRLIGTTTASLMKRSPCPVLAIPLGARFKGFKQIMYASDHTRLDAVFSSFLLEWAKRFGSELLVLNIQQDNASHFSLEMEVPEVIRHYYPYDKYHFLTEVNISPQKAIEQLIRKNRPQLLALTVRKRGFLERLFHHSVLRELAFQPPVPLLALPEELIIERAMTGEAEKRYLAQA